MKFLLLCFCTSTLVASVSSFSGYGTTYSVNQFNGQLFFDNRIIYSDGSHNFRLKNSYSASFQKRGVVDSWNGVSGAYYDYVLDNKFSFFGFGEMGLKVVPDVRTNHLGGLGAKLTVYRTNSFEYSTSFAPIVNNFYLNNGMGLRRTISYSSRNRVIFLLDKHVIAVPYFLAVDSKGEYNHSLQVEYTYLFNELYLVKSSVNYTYVSLVKQSDIVFTSMVAVTL